MKKKSTHWPLTILGSASSLFNLFLPVVMSRRMSVADVGQFKVFFLYLAAVPALSLGVGFTNGTYLWGADRFTAPDKVRAALYLAVLAGVAATAVSLGAGAYFGWSEAVLLFAFACAPAVAATIYEASLVASGEVRSAALFSAGFEFVRLATLMTALLLGSPLVTIFLLHGVVSWLKLTAGLLALGRPSGAAFRKETTGLLLYAMPVSAASIFDLLVQNGDRYVLSGILSTSSFALYSFGCLMVPPLFVFEQAVNQVLIPKLAQAKPRSRAASLHFLVAQEDLLLLLIPSAAGLIALADPLIRFLFTDAYREAALYLQWYALFYALMAIPQDVLARARGDSGWVFRTSVAFGLLAIAASFTGAKLFGPMGALGAFLLVQLARRLWALWYFANKEKPVCFPLKSAAVVVFAAACAGAAAHLTGNCFSKPAHAFLLGAAAFGPVYFGIVFAFRRRAIFRLLKFRRRR